MTTTNGFADAFAPSFQALTALAVDPSVNRIRTASFYSLVTKGTWSATGASPSAVTISGDNATFATNTNAIVQANQMTGAFEISCDIVQTQHQYVGFDKLPGDTGTFATIAVLVTGSQAPDPNNRLFVTVGSNTVVNQQIDASAYSRVKLIWNGISKYRVFLDSVLVASGSVANVGATVYPKFYIAQQQTII